MYLEQQSTQTNLRHDNVLAFLDEFVLGFHDGLQELEIVHAAPVSLDTVYKMLYHSLVNLTTQLEVIHEDVLHGYRLQNLKNTNKKENNREKS